MRASVVAFLACALPNGVLDARPVLELQRQKTVPIVYNASSRVAPGLINVHLQPHTHLDAGWLKTFDEYLIGRNNTIQPAGVRWIFDSVITALERDPARKFTLVEMGFFMRWYDMQLPARQAQVRGFVASGQVQITNGGYVMHDEATPTWADMIDQTTLGHRLINATFGPAAAPRSTWQIDPFGHSAAQGSHLTALAGMSACYYGRIDWQERLWRLENNATEYAWRPSAALGAGAQALAGFNVNGYDPPMIRDNGPYEPVFEWDVSSDRDGKPPLRFGPLQPDPQLDGENVVAYVNATVFLARQQAAYTLPDADGTVHLAWQMGTDFNYAQAEMWFTQLDGLVHFVNLNSSDHGVNLLYSTPQEYADAKLAQRTAWPLKAATAVSPGGNVVSTDQFPYATNPHWQWTGYFSSRPSFKGYVRACSAVYAAARQLQAFTGGAPADGLAPSNPLYRLERALAVAQHHDAVSGTERQHVAFDYAAALAAGRADAAQLTDAALQALAGFAPPGGAGFALCELANATICPALEAAAAPVLVLAYNAQSRRRAAAPLRLPVGLPAGVKSWAVTGPGGAAVTAQLLPPSPVDASLRTDYYGVPPAPLAWLAMQAAAPAMGYAAYLLTPVPDAALAPHTHASDVAVVEAGGAAGDQTLSNGVVTLTLAGDTGLVSALTRGGVTTPLTQELLYYRASAGCPLPPAPCDIPNDGTGLSAYGQAATTYILRPNSSAPTVLAGAGAPAALTLVTGPVLSEARQLAGGGWTSVVLRLWAGATAVEAEWTVGPVAVADGWGKEVIARWTAGGGWGAGAPVDFFTDANGLEAQRRVLGERSFPANGTAYEPIGAAYYPVTTRAHLEDAASGRRLTLAVDRAQGCASLARGALECMLHRRLLVDNFLGNGEPLNEPGPGWTGGGLVARGTHTLLLDDAAAAPGAAAAAALDGVLPLLAFLGAGPPASASTASSYRDVYSGLAAAVPPQLHVLTVQSLGAGALLLRVQHLFGADEDAALSANATLPLRALFAAFNVTAAVETTLTASLPLTAVRPWTLAVQGEGTPVMLPIIPPPPAGPDLLVTLSPQQIRTFVAQVDGQ